MRGRNECHCLRNTTTMVVTRNVFWALLRRTSFSCSARNELVRTCICAMRVQYMNIYIYMWYIYLYIIILHIYERSKLMSLSEEHNDHGGHKKCFFERCFVEQAFLVLLATSLFAHIYVRCESSIWIYIYIYIYVIYIYNHLTYIISICFIWCSIRFTSRLQRYWLFGYQHTHICSLPRHR